MAMTMTVAAILLKHNINNNNFNIVAFENAMDFSCMSIYFLLSIILIITIVSFIIIIIFHQRRNKSPSKLQATRQIHMGGRIITVIGTITGAAISTLIAVYFHNYYKPKKYGKRNIISDESHPNSMEKETDNTTKVLYMGPWGYSGDETSFNHNGYDGIKKIIIYSERMIHTIQVQYTKNGQVVWTPAVGKGLGNRTEIVLEDGECLTEVKGYHEPQPFLSINSLTFITNLNNKFGPYGIDDKIPLEKKIPFQVKGGKIVGFHGKQFQNLLSAIGFYVETMEDLPIQTELMASKGNDKIGKKADGIPKVKYMGPWGYQGEGMIFDHNGYSGIKKIIIYYGIMIDSIVVQYTKNGQFVWTDQVGKKGNSHSHTEIVLEDGEHLTEVEGYCFRQTSNTIHSLTFFTNLNKKFGPYGINNDIPSKFKTPFHVKGGKIVGFHWRTNLDILYAVGFYVESVEASPTQIELVDSEAKEKMTEKVGSTMEVIYVGPWGYLGEGKVFDHNGYNGIKKIIIYYGMMINSIQVQYIKDGKLIWTDEVSKDGIRKEIVLEDGEHLTEVRGYYGRLFGMGSISDLTFFSNLNRVFGPYGNDGEIPLEESRPFQVKGGKIVGFHGKAGAQFLSAIGFYIALHPNDRSPT